MNNKICSRCILDTTVPEIYFNNNGVCNYCEINDEIMKEYPDGGEGAELLEFCQQELASAEGKLNEMRLSEVEDKLSE